MCVTISHNDGVMQVVIEQKFLEKCSADKKRRQKFGKQFFRINQNK
jgi:hypothetical protein